MRRSTRIGGAENERRWGSGASLGDSVPVDKTEARMMLSGEAMHDGLNPRWRAAESQDWVGGCCFACHTAGAESGAFKSEFLEREGNKRIKWDDMVKGRNVWLAQTETGVHAGSIRFDARGAKQALPPVASSGDRGKMRSIFPIRSGHRCLCASGAGAAVRPRSNISELCLMQSDDAAKNVRLVDVGRVCRAEMRKREAGARRRKIRLAGAQIVLCAAAIAVKGFGQV